MKRVRTIVEELRRLLNTPNGASDAWDCFHERLVREQEFLDGSHPCTHPELVMAIETSLEKISRRLAPIESVMLVHAKEFGLVHGAGKAGSNLVFIVFCEQTRRGIVGLPFMKSGQMMLMHIAISEHPAESFPMAPASC